MANNVPGGVSFPFLNSIKGVMGSKTRQESLLTSIQCILTTPKRSVVYDPERGSHVPSLVHQLMTDSIINLLMYYSVNDVESQDPRIKITSIEINIDTPRKIVIWLGFIDRDDYSKTNYQAPVDFYRG